MRADAADWDRTAAARRRALQAEKDAVLATQRKEIDTRWAADGRRAVEAAIGAVDEGAPGRWSTRRARTRPRPRRRGGRAPYVVTRARGPRRGGAPRGRPRRPTATPGSCRSTRWSRGAAGSRAVGAVADDAVVAAALGARAEAPGSATDVAALRAPGVGACGRRRAAVRGPRVHVLFFCARAVGECVEGETTADAVAATMAQSICRHCRDHSARWERVASMVSAPHTPSPPSPRLTAIRRRRWSRSTPGPSRARRSGGSSRRCACPGPRAAGQPARGGGGARRGARARRRRRRARRARGGRGRPRALGPRLAPRRRAASCVAARTDRVPRRGRGWWRRAAGGVVYTQDAIGNPHGSGPGDVPLERGRGSIRAAFGKPRQDRRAATAALARLGSVAGFTARALASARPRGEEGLVVLERRGARLALVLARLERGVHLLGADGLDLRG